MQKTVSGTRYDEQFKLVIVGHRSVGKTCVLLSINDEKIPTEHVPTLGMDFQVYKYTSKSGLKVKMQIWDSAGQESLWTLTKTMFNGSDGVILVYDVTDQESFDTVQMWTKHIKEKTDEKSIKFLIGNKIDKVGWVVS